MRTATGHRHRVLVAATIVLGLAVLGTDIWLLSQRNRTTTVDLTEALDRFRTSSATPPPASTTPAGGTDTMAMGTPAQDASGNRPAAAAEGTASRPTPAAPPSATVTAPTAPAVVDGRPRQGVYTYRTNGGEKISVAGASHRYPERTYASVRHGAGCLWEIESDVIEEHRDHRQLCSDGTSVLQLSQTREIEFFGKREKFTLVCDPALALERAAEAAGSTVATTCRNEDTKADLQRTFLGTETMDVGGRQVTVNHIHIIGEVTGKATGRFEEHMWTLPGSGLTVRWRRMVDNNADAAFGAQVHYREDVEFVLESLDPQV